MKIAILSRNPNLYSTRRLVEAGKNAGIRCRCWIIPNVYWYWKKETRMCFIKGAEVKDIQAIIPRIGASVTFYGSAVVRQFEQMRIFSSVESQALVRSRDKLRSLQLLAKAGVDMPKTAFASSPKNIDNVISQVGGAPCVIKLLEGTQGIGVILAETHNSAKSVIEAFLDVKVNILVQEFIEEAKGSDIRAFVVDGQVVGAMRRVGAPGDFRSNLHRGGSASVVELSPEEKATAIKSVKKLGLAIAGVDMLQSKRGPLVMEVNSSPGLEGIEAATKIDIATKIIDYVERNEFHAHL